jgi:hypothetical protein
VRRKKAGASHFWLYKQNMVVAVAIWIIGFFSAPLILYTRKDAMLIKILLLAFSSPPLCLAHGHAHRILGFTSASVYFFGVGWSVPVCLGLTKNTWAFRQQGMSFTTSILKEISVKNG